MKTPKMMMSLMMFLLAISGIYAQNSMPIMQTLVGEHGNAWLGEKLVVMDFNADSFDDLVVTTSKSGPDQEIGLMVYFGGNDFNSIADLTRLNQPPWLSAPNSVLNAGDVNADGIDDLMTLDFYHSDWDSVAIHFYYGGSNADLEYDYEIIIQADEGTPQIRPLSCIGDVNNDGYDDLGCSVWANDEYIGDFKLAILYGGTWELQIITEKVATNRHWDIEGVGDTNGDGIADFVTGYAVTTPNGLVTSRNLHLGGNPDNIMNPIVMYQVVDGGGTFSAAYGIGDFNGDGYDDMVYCNGDSWYDNNKIRLGGTDIMMTEEFTVESFSAANLLQLGSWQKVAYGDFNGDGYSDLAGSDWIAFTWIGHAGIWLGKAIPNGMYDLRISSPPTSPFHQFGWQLAAGDFNGDGFCDLAVSAPQSDSPNPWYNGYVYIFAGNAQLADTTVANEDPVLVPEQAGFGMRYYPNPQAGDSSGISYEIEGKIPDLTTQATLTIHNIKGQLIKQIDVEADQLRKGTGTISTPRMNPGVYIISLWLNGTKKNSEKIVIK